MISTNFISFSVLNKSILMRGVVALLLLVSFGLFNVATAEAGTLPGYDIDNPKMSTPSISLNYSEVARAENNITIILSGQVSPFTAFSYKINDTIIDMPPKPLYKAYGFVLPTDKVRGFKVGENEISLRLCSAEGCGEWSQPAILKITSYVTDSGCSADATQGVCGAFIKSTQSKIVDGKVYPYHYTLLNDPLNSELRKPNIVSANVPSSINIGSILNRFWDWIVTDNDLVDRYQIKVNGKITENYTSAIWNVTGALNAFEFNGFKVGDNKVSVRQCNYKGCSPWSNEINVKVSDADGRYFGVNCSNYLSNTAVQGNHVVKAKSSGTLFNNGSFFSTDSDLGALATYLGAPVGSVVQLSFSTINTNKDRCGNNYLSTTKNGITTTEYLNQSAYKLNMKVNMTVLCTGSDCAYSGQDYSHVPSSGSNTNTTNTGNAGTTNTTTSTGTTNTTTLPTPVASQCLGDSAPVSQTVTATQFGSVYGIGPFTTGSSLGKIAAYLGAPIGSSATLSIVDAGCLNNYRSGTNNGITTTPWYSTWRGMVVSCTSGCGVNTTTGTSNTTSTGNTGSTLGVSGDLSSMSYTELLNLLKTLTDYLNNLISSAGGTNVGTNTNTTTNTGSTTGACLGDPAPASQTVTANNSPFKFVYGTGPFTTGSDLGKIAAYLGAPVGSEAHLQITDIGCIKNYNYTVQNGVTSIGWPAEWHGMNVVCTSGCTGGGSVGTGSGGNGTVTTEAGTVVDISSIPYNVGPCVGSAAPASRRVIASGSGDIIGSSPFFAVGYSDLSRIATYLGAPVGGVADLLVVDTGCKTKFESSTKNNITTTSWNIQQGWQSMEVICTNGCNGSFVDDINPHIINNVTSKIKKPVGVNMGAVGFSVFHKTMGSSAEISWKIDGNNVSNENNQLFDFVQIKVNSKIDQLKSNRVFYHEQNENFNLRTDLVPYNGYFAGDNEISIRLCKEDEGCGPWSENFTLKLNGWTSCGSTLAMTVTKSVVSTNDGVVYGGELPHGGTMTYGVVKYKYNVFGTRSDFGTIAAYLGAPIGSKAELKIIGGFLCPESYYSSTKNEITTRKYANYPNSAGRYDPGINVICTSGCGTTSQVTNTTTTNTTTTTGNTSNTGSISTVAPVFPSSGTASFRVVGADMPIDVGASSNIMIVTLGSAGIRIVDISNASSPKVLSDLKLTDNSISSLTPIKSKNIFVSGTKAYVTSESRLFIIDIANPSKPKILGIAGASKPKSITVVGNYAYMIGAYGLEVWDVSDSTKPVKAGGSSLPNHLATGAYVANQMAFIYGGIENPEVRDLRNLTKIMPVTTIPTGPANDITGGGMYVATNNGLMISESVALTDSIHRSGGPAIIGKFTSSTPYKNVEFYGGKVYAVTNSYLQTIDVSDKKNPKFVKNYSVFGGLGLVIDKGIAYIPTSSGVTMVELK